MVSIGIYKADRPGRPVDYKQSTHLASTLLFLQIAACKLPEKKMRIALTCLLIVGAVAAEAQFSPFAYPGQYYFRGSSGFPQPSYDIDQQQRLQDPAAAGRIFFSTLTVTLSTSTVTSTATSTFTCTTSTSALKVW